MSAASPAIVPRDTIAAISTAAGEGAIAVVRMTGNGAVAAADQVFRGKQIPSRAESHHQHFGQVVNGDRVIDEVMIVVHRGPASYTGEDVVEISCHGGMLVTARVLDACLTAGARAAEPGEFTERAFLNGKMDLTQAEAVIDLIRARTDLAMRAAHEQLSGRLGDEIAAIRAEIIALLAQVEASIDFPDEDIEPESESAWGARLQEIRRRLDALLATADRGRILREGVRAVIYGATNAGKSSLLNRLLGFDRAIVSDIPGTTRDTIEEVVNLRGIALRILDTAGIRPATDALERAGIARTEGALAGADIVLHVVDSHAPKPSGFDQLPTEQPRILLLNKADLPEHADWAQTAALRISCTHDDGLRGLEEAIVGSISGGNIQPESGFAINVRHRACLERAAAAATHAAVAMTAGAEFVAVDLRDALRAVGEVLGGSDHEAVLDSVFAQFCIGK